MCLWIYLICFITSYSNVYKIRDVYNNISWMLPWDIYIYNISSSILLVKIKRYFMCMIIDTFWFQYVLSIENLTFNIQYLNLAKTTPFIALHYLVDWTFCGWMVANLHDLNFMPQGLILILKVLVIFAESLKDFYWI